jgi:hypothetical protein
MHGSPFMKLGSRLAILMLGGVALAHLLRLAGRVEIAVDGVAVPQWVSAFGVLVPGGIALLLWREGRRDPGRLAD